MQIAFFIIATFITGVTSVYNLGSGFVGEATWVSFLLSCLVFATWLIWIFIVISHSGKVKNVTIGISGFFALCMIGLFLYANWEAISKVSIFGGIGIASGLFLGLPFVGFSKLLGNLTYSRYLLLIPYVLLIIFAWFIYAYVNKSGIAVEYAEKQTAKMEQKKSKKENRLADTEMKKEKASDSFEKVLETKETVNVGEENTESVEEKFKEVVIEEPPEDIVDIEDDAFVSNIREDEIFEDIEAFKEFEEEAEEDKDFKENKGIDEIQYLN